MLRTALRSSSRHGSPLFRPGGCNGCDCAFEGGTFQSVLAPEDDNPVARNRWDFPVDSHLFKQYRFLSKLLSTQCRIIAIYSLSGCISAELLHNCCMLYRCVSDNKRAISDPSATSDSRKEFSRSYRFWKHIYLTVNTSWLLSRLHIFHRVLYWKNVFGSI